MVVFKIKISHAEIDIRVSTFPTIYGESIVMRLLNTSSTLLGLDHLGFKDREFQEYQKIINKSYGLILVTGPYR